MSTPNSVISQLQSDLRLANETTGMNDATIHEAIATLVSGFGSSGGKVKKITGTVTSYDNSTTITHNANSKRYLMIINASYVPENTGGAWISKNVIGLYDKDGIKFNNDIFKTVSAGTRHKDLTIAMTVWCGNTSTENAFNYNGNALPNNVECTWELYDLSDS